MLKYIPWYSRQRKLNSQKIFDSVNLRYEINTCNVHTKTFVMNALLLTWFNAHSRSQFEATSSRRVVFQIPKDRCQHVCQRKQLPLRTRPVEKAIVDKGLGKKHNQYFIFMVASDAASSFVLFHAA